MAILTNDILKLGNFMVGEFYEVETRTPSQDEYAARFIQAYGRDSIQYMNPLKRFEHCLWQDGWDASKVKEDIEKLSMPTGEFAINKLEHEIWEIAHWAFVNDDHISWGRQIHTGLLTVDVMYEFKPGIPVNLLHIELTLNEHPHRRYNGNGPLPRR